MVVLDPVRLTSTAPPKLGSNSIRGAHRNARRHATPSLLRERPDKDDCADLVVTMCRSDSITGQTIFIGPDRGRHAARGPAAAVYPPAHRPCARFAWRRPSAAISQRTYGQQQHHRLGPGAVRPAARHHDGDGRRLREQDAPRQRRLRLHRDARFRARLPDADPGPAGRRPGAPPRPGHGDALLAPKAEASLYPRKDTKHKIPLAMRHLRTFLPGASTRSSRRPIRWGRRNESAAGTSSAAPGRTGQTRTSRGARPVSQM